MDLPIAEHLFQSDRLQPDLGHFKILWPDGFVHSSGQQKLSGSAQLTYPIVLSVQCANLDGRAEVFWFVSITTADENVSSSETRQ